MSRRKSMSPRSSSHSALSMIRDPPSTDLLEPLTGSGLAGRSPAALAPEAGDAVHGLIYKGGELPPAQDLQADPELERLRPRRRRLRHSGPPEATRIGPVHGSGIPHQERAARSRHSEQRIEVEAERVGVRYPA